MRIHVDRELCEGNALCEGIAPEVFQVDEEDDLHVLADPTPDNVEQVHRAVQSCPKAALRLD